MNGDKQDTLGRIILGGVFRTLLATIITFLVTRHVLQAEVYEKLMRGDTVSLFQGNIPINLTMITNVAVGLVLPIMLPLVWGIWIRITAVYRHIVEKAEAFGAGVDSTKITKKVEKKVADASLTAMVRTVASGEVSV